MFFSVRKSLMSSARGFAISSLYVPIPTQLIPYVEPATGVPTKVICNVVAVTEVTLKRVCVPVPPPGLQE
jgi:hypothetical protein